MSEGSQRSGFYLSGALHAALLGMLVVGFSQAPKFDDSAESIPVETVTQSQLNEIMKGERDAKPREAPAQPPPRPQAAIAPPTPPEPPPDLRRIDDAAPQPPPKPVDFEPTPPPPTPPAPPVKATPAPPKPVAQDAPEPPVKPKVVEKPPEKPKETPPEKPKPDAFAKLMAKEKTEPAKEPPKEPTRPPAKTYDPNAIAKLLGQTKTADATPTGATPQGLPTQHSARMSPSLSAGLDAWLTDAYFSCWSPPPMAPPGERYVADVRVVFNPDGSLSGQPVLTNPPRDPAWRAHAESAVRAVLKCNPMHIPAQYAPYFEQWKSKTIHFDPQDALG